MENKKQILLRISKTLYEDIAKWSEDDFRSINGQIEYILSESVKAKRKSKTTNAVQEKGEIV
jgi:hypothetical protein